MCRKEALCDYYLHQDGVCLVWPRGRPRPVQSRELISEYNPSSHIRALSHHVSVPRPKVAGSGCWAIVFLTALGRAIALGSLLGLNTNLARLLGLNVVALPRASKDMIRIENAGAALFGSSPSSLVVYYVKSKVCSRGL